MAGMKEKRRGSRNPYTDAGYRVDPKKQDEIFIHTPMHDAEVIRSVDRSEWEDIAMAPLYKSSVSEEKKTETQSSKKRNRQPKKMRFSDWIAEEAKKDMPFIFASIVLVAILLTFTALECRQLGKGVEIQRTIDDYQRKIENLVADNADLTSRIEAASSDEYINARAQNYLRMVRPENVQPEKIVIQVTDQIDKKEQSGERQEFGVLDVVLGLLNMWNIGE